MPFIDEDRPRRRDSAECCRALWAATIASAIADALDIDPKSHWERKLARKWILSDDHSIYSFLWACDHTHQDAEGIRWIIKMGDVAITTKLRILRIAGI